MPGSAPEVLGFCPCRHFPGEAASSQSIFLSCPACGRAGVRGTPLTGQPGPRTTAALTHLLIYTLHPKVAPGLPSSMQMQEIRLPSSQTAWLTPPPQPLTFSQKAHRGKVGILSHHTLPRIQSFSVRAAK